MRTVILTEQNVMDGASNHGAWSRTQLALLGVAWPPKPRWKERVIGRPIDADDLSKFLHIKDAHKDRHPGDKKKEREEYEAISKRKKLY